MARGLLLQVALTWIAIPWDGAEQGIPN